MKKPTEYRPGDEISTKDGNGILIAIKNSNFRNQNFKVLFANGQSHWYTILELLEVYKTTSKKAA